MKRLKKFESSGDYIDFITQNCDVYNGWLIALSNKSKEEEMDRILKDKEGFWFNEPTKELNYRQRVIGKITFEK